MKKGTQLDGDTLYQKQQEILKSVNYIKAPGIIADDLQTPENYGSVLRLADAAGCRNVTFLKGMYEVNENKIVKTARNTDKIIDWRISPKNRFSLEAEAFRNPLIAIELTSESSDLYQTKLPENCTFVIGNERSGISDEVLSMCDSAVHIPMFGSNGSMNVTHALAIVLFEWRRQHVQL